MSADDHLLRDLIRLFDDTDETVTQCVDSRLRAMGRSVVRSLARAAAEAQDESERKLILDRMSGINLEFRLEDLRRLAASSSGEGFSLYEPAFVISSAFDAGLTREEFQRMYCGCAAAFQEGISELRTAPENMEIFNHIFFRTLGFSISDDNFTDPESALLPDVMARRRGNPFSIAFLWFMMAEEAGLPLYPACFKGGFIPAYLENGRELFYVNLNDKGALFSEAGGQIAHVHSRRVIPGIWAESLSAVFSRCAMERRRSLAELMLAAWTGERFLDAETI